MFRLYIGKGYMFKGYKVSFIKLKRFRLYRIFFVIDVELSYKLINRKIFKYFEIK